MDTIEIHVPHFYNHTILYPFMSESLFEILHDAFEHHEKIARVPRKDFEAMIEAYMDTLKN